MLKVEQLPGPGVKLVGFSSQPICLLEVECLPCGRSMKAALTTRDGQILTDRALPVDAHGLRVINFIIEESANLAEFKWRYEDQSLKLPQHMHDFVYFISDEDGYIKIGKASNVRARFAQLQTSARQELTVLSTVRGGHVLEAELHEKFSHLHVRGEWFKPSDELLRYIALTKLGGD